MPPDGRALAFRPWTLTLYDRAPVPAAVLGVGFGALYLLGIAALALATGRYHGTPVADAPWAATGAWAELVNAVLFGWPFDGSTVVRAALYVTIGLGSRVGGALVERLVGAVFE